MEENESIREVHDPSVGVVGREAGKNLSGPLVVSEGVVEVLGVAQVLEEIREWDSVGDIEASHRLFSQAYWPQHACLEILSFSQADKDFGLLFLQISQ